MACTRSTPGLILALLLLALLAAPVAGAARIVVAAADAPAEVRGAADFVCDGVDDQFEINRAFDAVPWDGGTVLLSAGTFRCGDNLVPGPYTTIQGAGAGATTVAISGYYHAIKVDRPYVTIRDLRITDRAWVRITASHIRVENVLAEDDLHGYYPGKPNDMGANGAFFVWAENRIVEDVLFYHCVARNIGTHGFNMNGAGSPRLTRDIRFIECEAIRCGDADGHPWATGFDFHEANDLVDLMVERCYAADNWESGFHFEPGGLQEGITLIDCISEENGWRNTNLGDFTVTPAVPAHFYMAGYTIAKGTVLVNCRSIHNRNYGFYDEQGGDNTFISCSDTQSGYGWKLCKNFEDVTLIDCVAIDPAQWALWAAWGTRLQVNSFHQYNASGRKDVDPLVQSILGWYKGEEKYERPVTDSFLEITAHGPTEPPILNLNDSYNGPDCNNVYELSWSNETPVLPDATPLPRETPPPTASVTPLPQMTPSFPAVHTVPGRIEAEHYLPGRDIGFHDTTAGNEGAIYRFDDVDIEYTAAINGYNLGFVRAGEWVAYDLDVTAAGRYDTAFLVAAPFTGRSFMVQVDGADVGRVSVPATGGYDKFSSVVLPFDLPAGRHRLRLVFDHADNVNLDRVELRAVGTPTGTATATPSATETGSLAHALPGRVPATAFAGAAPGATPDGDTLHVPAGAWVRYRVTVPSAAIYAFTLESAVGTGGTATVETDGIIGGSVSFPSRGPQDIAGVGYLLGGSVNLTLRFDTAASYRALTVAALAMPNMTATATPTPIPTGTATPGMTPSASMTATPEPTATGTAAVPELGQIPGGAGLPGCTRMDGCYDDVNGNGRRDFADVVLYFNQLEWIAANEPVSAFDYNGNGRCDFGDVVWLFNAL